tara:strand:+ start:605 stop:2173 length:1569 start_codon:yes stop_codon:yes gene_type:complete
MPLDYNCKQSLQTKILKGVDILADNVASTLGPRGRNVILQEKGKRPIITKDGVTVARFVHLEDPFENLGAQVIKQASEQTNTEAGDGTTTSTVLARAILREAQKYIAAGVSPIEIKRGADRAVEEIINCLSGESRPISSFEDIEHIATISANGDKTIGKLISLAVDQAGKDGAITIEDGRGLETSLDVLEGFRFDSGYVASAFITDERRGAVKYENPLIMVTDRKLDNIEDLLPVLEIVARDNKPFIIIADEIEGQALAALIMNTVRGSMKIAAIKAPRYGQERRNLLSDLALSVGATFITRESGIDLKEAKLEHLGKAKTIESLKYFTTIVDGKGDSDEIEKRIDALKVEIEQTDDMHECEKIQDRITRLASGIAVIKVGAATEIEMIEKKHRIEDALEAVKSAQDEGVVPGGGVALLRAGLKASVEVENEEQEIGVKVVKEAVKEPIRQIAKNAGLAPDISLEKVKTTEGSDGLDFTTNEIVDMFEKGIIDPVKVTRCALKNATSVASTLLTTDYAIVEK